jgi:hypothetical protein
MHPCKAYDALNDEEKKLVLCLKEDAEELYELGKF